MQVKARAPAEWFKRTAFESPTSTAMWRNMMRVKDVMAKNVVSVSPRATVAEALGAMVRANVSGLPVIENGALVGIVSEADFLRRAELGTAKSGIDWRQAISLPARRA